MAIRMTFRPGLFRELEGDVRTKLADAGVMERMAAKDFTVWKPEPTEIVNRLGWLDIHTRMLSQTEEIDAVVDAVREDGYNFALLIGMGGSSLAPEVFRKIFGVFGGYINLEVLDTTDPGAILTYAACCDFEKTLFIVSTKSGGTIETLSLMKYFYNLAVQRLGREKAGRHFVAITDPGSMLAETAVKNGFRHIFYGDPEIGGRYSALSMFGLVPARLLGIDVKWLLGHVDQTIAKTDGALLGGLLGEMAMRGRDKLTFVFSQRLASLGGWIEQLVAESTGKEGKGILPVNMEPSGASWFYGNDRVFCSVRFRNDAIGEPHLRGMVTAGHPVVDLTIDDSYDLGGLFYFWEVATAVAGWRMEVNPFDQPNVESAKVKTRKMIEQYMKERVLHEDTLKAAGEGFSLFGNVDIKEQEDVLGDFFSQAGASPPAYAAFMAYLQPSPWIDDAIQRLRGAIVGRFSIATTFGYGPRFLHSTGQLHKGDAGRGLFVQFTADDNEDVPVPDSMESADSAITFGIVKRAQALGDAGALVEGGRKVLRIHFSRSADREIDRLTKVLERKR